MPALQPTANKTLKGHKLVVLLGVTAPPKMLLGATFLPEEIAELKERFPDLSVIVVEGTIAEGESLPQKFANDQWQDVTILVTGSALPRPGHASKLQYVQLQTAGTNHLSDHPLYRDTSVKFCTASGVHGPQIAAWVITTFLNFELKIGHYMELHQKSQWRKLSHSQEDIVSQRVGILGYGSVGRQVARVTRALGMDVHVCTLRSKTTPQSRISTSYTPKDLGDPDGTLPSQWFSTEEAGSLHDFLQNLDLLVVAIPLTEKTRGLISRKEFKILSKRRTFVSNVSRGAVIVTEDLIYALDHDWIRGAAVDVTDPEPLPETHRLWKAKNLIITPHISGDSSAYVRRVFEILKHNLSRLSKGRELLNEVNKEEGY